MEDFYFLCSVITINPFRNIFLMSFSPLQYSTAISRGMFEIMSNIYEKTFLVKILFLQKSSITNVWQIPKIQKSSGTIFKPADTVFNPFMTEADII